VEALRSAQPVGAQPFTYAEAASGLQSLQRAEFVYVRKGSVVPPFFKLEIRGQPKLISVDSLKPHLGTAQVTVASPPQPGHPRDLVQWRPPVLHLRPPLGKPLWRMKSRSSRVGNPRPNNDDYINVLPDFLCQLFFDAH
jgi:hypothetical protein